jgi:pectinesterase
MGTFNSYTVYVGAEGVRLRGLSIENSAGDGRLVGPAVALYADSDLFSAEDCRISSRQDSLCTGPLPKNPPPKGINLIHPVAGLGAHQPKLPFRQHYRRCLIEGDVDFIFGSSLALFEDSEIRSLGRQGSESAGWIAAPSTYPGQKAGFVFWNCALTSAPTSGPDAPKSYLARPWRHSGRAAFISCNMGRHIVPEGWDDWAKPEARVYGGFGEFASSGPGAASENFRAPWAKMLSQDEAEAFSPESLFKQAIF